MKNNGLISIILAKITLVRKSRIIIVASLVVCLLGACKEQKESINHCNVENPLTDLLWLKEFIEGCERDAEAGYPQHARIYQCTYRDGDGFLLETCVGCPDFGLWLRSCTGESLCVLDGYAGNTCEEFDVDLEAKILIWDSNH